MARKDLLKGLMGDEPAKPESKSRVDASKPRYNKGAIGAVSRSIADLKNRSVVEIDPHEIDAGGVMDRLEFDEADHQRLMASLKEYGQQVPILVREHPENEGRYQIVYGRRRVLAMRDLGLPIKAMIRDLDDEALLMAQGQENSARRDLSFIERAYFAKQMADAEYERKAICDALSVDKTVISRMLSITDVLPTDLIRMIGSAHGVGRDRWLALSRYWSDNGVDTEDAHSMLAVHNATTSDERFDVIFNWLSTRGQSPKDKPSKPEVKALRGEDGKALGKVTQTPNATTFVFKVRTSDGFDDWLVENIEEIHRDWIKSTGG